jgi:hypothetical protein
VLTRLTFETVGARDAASVDTFALREVFAFAIFCRGENFHQLTMK